MISLLGFIITIMLLVFVHEFGHYYVAKLCNVKIEQFSIGFGKPIFSHIDKNEVQWKLGYLPLGGYVKMYGDSDPSSSGHIAAREPERAFYTKPLWQRFVIVLAGPLANYSLAIIILTMFYFCFGKIEVPAIIDEVLVSSPAEAAGLIAGDVVLAADGKKIKNFGDLQKIIMINTGQPISIVVNRSKQNIKLQVTPSLKSYEQGEPKSQTGFIGIKAGNTHNLINMGIFKSTGAAIKDVMEISALTLKAFGQMITGSRSINEIHGPLTIAQESGRSLSNGYLSFVIFIAMLSINLGLINLLPIPVLDGGHLMMMMIELIAGKPLNMQYQNLLLKLGFSILVFLIVISALNDIKSLIF